MQKAVIYLFKQYKMNIQNNSLAQSYHIAGTITLALRLVIGWTYFSAFWRRLILANKLDPDAAGYIGEKFNHFLPNALGIKPLIEYLVTHPDALYIAMVAFTIIEAVVGLFILLGFFTRLMSLGVMGLALGILLGSGWIGTTCLDEWQIGILGISGGFILFLSGSGSFSIDKWLKQKVFSFTKKKWFLYIASGILPLTVKRITVVSAIGAAVILFLTLFTNQYFHGGVWGQLHNKSIKPKVELTNGAINGNTLSFTVNRVEGVDVYGSFLIVISLVDKTGNIFYTLNGNALSQLAEKNISNKYVAKVKPGKYSLVIPLGAKADIKLEDDVFKTLQASNYWLVLTDISGIEWKTKVDIK